jgi:hypothetical protein
MHKDGCYFGIPDDLFVLGSEKYNKWNTRTPQPIGEEEEIHPRILEWHRMLEWRNIEPGYDEPCKDCNGSGVKSYGSTATWHGGIGGQMFTSDVCDKCWGSGKDGKPWTDLKALAARLPKPIEGVVEELKDAIEKEFMIRTASGIWFKDTANMPAVITFTLAWLRSRETRRESRH